MRVVHLNTDPGVRPGKSKGAVVHVEAMRAALREAGAEVVALDAFEPAKIRHQLEQAREEGPIDLVYERFALHSDEAARFAGRHGLAHVLEVNAPLDEEEERHRPDRSAGVDRSALRDQLVGATALLCVSEDVAAWARDRGGAEARVEVVGNGVDTRLFDPARRAAGRARALAPEGAFVIGFHGRLRPWHAFERLVAALRHEDAAGLDYHLLMVGVGEFEALIGDALPSERWTHVPWCAHEEVGEYVASFDAMPLTYDPGEPCYFSPLKLLEGMAAGVVPLVPALGALPETVEHGGAGLVYDAHDLGSLARALRTLDRDREEHARLARAARARAARHSWLGIAQRVLRDHAATGAAVFGARRSDRAAAEADTSTRADGDSSAPEGPGSRKVEAR